LFLHAGDGDAETADEARRYLASHGVLAVAEPEAAAQADALLTILSEKAAAADAFWDRVQVARTAGLRPIVLLTCPRTRLGEMEGAVAARCPHADGALARARPAPRPAVKKTYSRAVKLLPALAEGGIADAWAGYVDSTPDGGPAIGEVPQVPGLILAAGFSGHGFGIGPGAGHLIADLVTGVAPIFDPAPYRPDRFNQSAWGKVADF